MFRSQMAAAIYNKLTGTKDADSVGTYVGAPEEPEGWKLSEIPWQPGFLDFMKKKEMDLSEARTKKLLPEMLEEADIIVSMAEEPFIPDFLKQNKKVIWWEVENPNGVDERVATETFDKLSTLISNLVEEQKIKV